ncbi:unnamed protein product [Caenorhabditis sp. 36 PRJEB53466]|nr:unnamed protein product [Caenorhabditis sp. 36 PRJEB53466]
MHKLLLVFLTLPLFISCSRRHRYGYDQYKTTCVAFGSLKLDWCDTVQGLKSFWRTQSIAWSPGKTKNMTFTELRSHCDDAFTCRENSGCFMDFVNYQQLDQCTVDIFELGPMSFCDDILREVLKKKPEELTDCVKVYLKDMSPSKFDCVSIKTRAECYIPNVEKHCEPNFAALYKEHSDLRLFNRACDGRLRYKDWDYKKGQEYGIQFVPGGIKVVDPKRNVTRLEVGPTEVTGAINSTNCSRV